MKPTCTVDAYTLSNDRLGYAVYSIVLFANPDQQARVQAIREAVKVRRSMMPAHVTARGGFCEIPGIEEVNGILEEVASRTYPFAVSFEGGPHAFTSARGEVLCTQPIRLAPELVGLHERLMEALDPVSTDAYHAGRPYRPHLTIYHEPEPSLEEEGVRLLKNLDIGAGFEVRELHFVGHVGRPYRGRWEQLSMHRFTD